MLIKNYGLFWSLEKTFLGWRNTAGHLKGVQATIGKSKSADFRFQQGVYVLYDANFKIVYVGQAGRGEGSRLFDRIKAHTRDQLAERWSKYSWFGIRGVNANSELEPEKGDTTVKISEVLNHMEGVLIAAAEPPHNKQGGRFGAESEQYVQIHDERLHSTWDARLDEIERNLDGIAKHIKKLK
jgi:hypothetical protein